MCFDQVHPSFPLFQFISSLAPTLSPPIFMCSMARGGVMKSHPCLMGYYQLMTVGKRVSFLQGCIQ